MYSLSDGILSQQKRRICYTDRALVSNGATPLVAYFSGELICNVNMKRGVGIEIRLTRDVR